MTNRRSATLTMPDGTQAGRIQVTEGQFFVLQDWARAWRKKMYRRGLMVSAVICTTIYLPWVILFG